jgi:ribonucleotide reductase alpha subunit
VDQCFTGSTLVFTENGPKRIIDIKVGDYVINGAGQLDIVYEKVEFIHSGKIMKINVSGATQTVSVTPEHPFLVIREKCDSRSDEDIEMGIKHGLTFPEYISAGELVLTDKMVVPNISNEGHASNSSKSECNYLTINSISYENVPKSNPIYVFDLKMTNSCQPSYLTEMGVCHNGGGKRNGSFAIYIEPWHPDIESFLDLKKNTGDEEQRARDLFYALWTPGLFMERVKTNQKWSLFCPDKCPGLADVYGDEFNKLYESYELQGMAEKQVSARDIWFKVLDCQMETGTPYILYKDACNQKSNQKNIGTIKSSNLCTEIVQYSDDKETAVCNLASINLTKFVQRLTPDWTSNNIVIIYTKPNCQYCIRAKMLMDDFGIQYTEHYVSDDEKRKELYSEISLLAGKVVNSVPQIISVNDGQCNDNTAMDTNYIGGFTDLQRKCDYSFDYKKLQETVQVIVRNLNKIINVNFYPTPKTKLSNLLHRPMGIGIQGLADTFQMMDLVFTGADAAELNTNIFAAIYHAAMTESCAISKRRCADMNEIYTAFSCGEIVFGNSRDDGVVEWSDDNSLNSLKSLVNLHQPIRAEMEMIKHQHVNSDETIDEIPYSTASHSTSAGSYSSFHGSPLSKGELQFDLWNVKPNSMYDWNELRANVIKYGVRNSLLVAPMPTASTSQILGNNECFEPMTSNLYSRRTNAGEFIIANRHLMRELERIGIWNVDLKNEIIRNSGSIRGIDVIPRDLHEKYEIAWEMPMKTIIEMARDRGIYTCQSQSMNLWVADPNYKNLTALHFKSWDLGLKTGSYYLRRKPKHQPQQFTIAPTTTTRGNSPIIANEIPIDVSKSEDGCEMCSG